MYLVTSCKNVILSVHTATNLVPQDPLEVKKIFLVPKKLQLELNDKKLCLASKHVPG